MALQVTKSVDKRMRATVRTQYRVGGVEIAVMLFRFGADRPDAISFAENPGREMSRLQVEEEVRRLLYDYGRDAYLADGGNYDDNLTDVENYLVTRWAIRQVRVCFPELVDDQLAGWEADSLASARKDAAKRLLWGGMHGEPFELPDVPELADVVEGEGDD